MVYILPSQPVTNYQLDITKYKMAQRLKCLPAMWETWVRSLSREDPLEKGMAIHFSILARRIPMDKEVWQTTFHGVCEGKVLWGHLRILPGA